VPSTSVHAIRLPGRNIGRPSSALSTLACASRVCCVLIRLKLAERSKHFRSSHVMRQSILALSCDSSLVPRLLYQCCIRGSLREKAYTACTNASGGGCCAAGALTATESNTVSRDVCGNNVRMPVRSDMFHDRTLRRYVSRYVCVFQSGLRRVRSFVVGHQKSSQIEAINNENNDMFTICLRYVCVLVRT
jgi:hypothetical protein